MFVVYLLVGHAVQTPILPLTVQLAMVQIGFVAVLGAVPRGGLELVTALDHELVDGFCPRRRPRPDRGVESRGDSAPVLHRPGCLEALQFGIDERSEHLEPSCFRVEDGLHAATISQTKS